MNAENIFSDIEKGGEDVGKFLADVVSDSAKVKSAVSQMSGPTTAAAILVFKDVVSAVAAGTAAAGAASTGNIPAAITLSENTITAVKQLVTDAKSGEKVVASDLAALGIKL